MALCIASAAGVAKIAAAFFTLAWTHSVEKTRWEEDWLIADGALRLMEARVQGSGAGMEPGADARFDGKFWRWTPRSQPQHALRLRQMPGSTPGWTLCANGTCRMIGADGDSDLTLTPCSD
ncbi:MAG: DUF1850 domain-containing protein [Alphaproteobacteria bacterium]|nr:DUF1850 domain-containing protein [Alphaproteobacteria bacterium]